MEINVAFLQISGQHASTTPSADDPYYPHDRVVGSPPKLGGAARSAGVVPNADCNISL